MPNSSRDQPETLLPPGCAVSVQSISKRYERSSSAGLLPRLRTGTGEFWALRDVSFDVRQGEGFGVIGGNGAGKSTLLKILARIVPPTGGRAVVRGRLNALLEVGTGFQRELSGRQNIFLNASVLGLSRVETEELFDEIVAFSGVGDFIDMPVGHYSSGMYSRLAFAIAAHVRGDVLLVDEVLSVGDAEFRRRSLSRMEALMDSQHRSVVFVSHSMDAVLRFCSRAVWLEKGTVRALGSAQDVVQEYLTSVADRTTIVSRAPDGAGESGADDAATALSDCPFLVADPDNDPVTAASIERVGTGTVSGKAQTVFFRDEPIRINALVRVCTVAAPLSLFVSVRCLPRKGVREEVIVFSDFSPSGMTAEGIQKMSVTVPPHLFGSGQYLVSLGVVTPGNPMIKHHFLKRVLPFQVVDREDSGEVVGDFVRGVIRPRLEWQVATLDNLVPNCTSS